MRSWIRSLSARRPSRPGLSFRPTVEVLEDRRVLSGNVLQTNLVSDLPNVAAVQDKNLVNPWGISESPGSTGSPFWISDNNAGVSTLYSVPGANSTPVSINSLVVSIPSPGDPLGNSGTPTGTVFNIALGSYSVPGEWYWIWPLLIAPHLVFAHSRAGRSVGLDLLLRRWLPSSYLRHTGLGRLLLRCM